MNIDNCSKCDRILQQSTIAEITGLCDRCREARALERTPLANNEYRSKTGETLTEKVTPADAVQQDMTVKEMRVAWHRAWRLRLAELLAERPEACVCDECVARWQEHG